jgi:hypothetical protein
MNNDSWYVINNLKDFINQSRYLVYTNFGDKESKEEYALKQLSSNEKQECDDVLSYEESLLIVKNLIRTQKNKTSKKIRHLISNDLFMDIIEQLNIRMVSNILNGLVKKGLVESAFDDEANDFIFWIKDNESKNFEKPETD